MLPSERCESSDGGHFWGLHHSEVTFDMNLPVTTEGPRTHWGEGELQASRQLFLATRPKGCFGIERQLRSLILMCVEALCLSGPERQTFAFFSFAWPASPQYGKENSCESVGIEMEGASASAARAVPMLPVTPRCHRGPLHNRAAEGGVGTGPRAPKAHQILTVRTLRLLFVPPLCRFSAGRRAHPCLEGSVQVGVRAWLCVEW